MKIKFLLNVQDVEKLLKGQRINAYIGDYDDLKLSVEVDLNEVKVKKHSDPAKAREGIFRLRLKNISN